jgi:hypothetical protein
MNATFDSMMGAMGFHRVEDEEYAQERAAIMHFDGGIPKEKAEALARAEVESYRAHKAKVVANGKAAKK